MLLKLISEFELSMRLFVSSRDVVAFLDPEALDSHVALTIQLLRVLAVVLFQQGLLAKP